MSRVAHQAGAYPGFRSMKRLGMLWDALIKKKLNKPRKDSLNVLRLLGNKFGSVSLKNSLDFVSFSLGFVEAANFRTVLKMVKSYPPSFVNINSAMSCAMGIT